MTTSSELQEQAKTVTVELLLTDSAMALTLLDLADTTRVATNRIRRLKEARKAYETILRFAAKLDMADEQRELLEQRLSRIHGRLLRAG